VTELLPYADDVIGRAPHQRLDLGGSSARAILLVGNSLTVFRITRSPSGWTRSPVAGAVRSAAGGTPFPGAVSPKAAVATAAPLLKNYAGNFDLAPRNV